MKLTQLVQIRSTVVSSVEVWMNVEIEVVDLEATTLKNVDVTFSFIKGLCCSCLF